MCMHGELWTERWARLIDEQWGDERNGLQKRERNQEEQRRGNDGAGRRATER